MQSALGRDVVAELGHLFLGSRLKRLAERMQADAAQLLAGAGLPLQPAQMPLLAALHRYGALTVGEAAEALGVSQPAVTRAVTSLRELGVVSAKSSPRDKRQTTLTLTARGRATMKKVQQRAWPHIDRAATQLCRGIEGDFLTQIARIEERLAQRSLRQRATEPTPVTFLPYRDDLAKAFYDINAEWIASMFALEPTDRDVLSHPRERIVDAGGEIWFASTPDHGVVGTCALYLSAPGELELTKMGVRERARGLKIGEQLLQLAIERARALGAHRLYLLANSRCEAAIHLYEKAGFVHDASIRKKYGARYQRCDVAMRFPLDAAKPRPRTPR